MRGCKMLIPFVSFVALGCAQDDPKEFFEKNIRPILATKCYACHSSKLSSPMGGLVLDTRAGLTKGGTTGPVVVPGKPAESRMLNALRYTDPSLQMPPTGKLADPVIADFERWILAGAVDPRLDAAAATGTQPLKGMPIETGRKWWAFQSVAELPAPPVKDRSWARSKIDSFLLAKLEAKGLKPSEPADAKTLVQRAYVDLIGIKPSYNEVEAFAKDTAPKAYERLIEQLLASPHYGERWGRHWLDVARFGEDNPAVEGTNPPHVFAWRYRDWVIEAINKDVPYDRFVKLQLAADLMSGTKRDDLRALGYLGAATTWHKDARESQEVLYTFATDDWDERVDAVTRGILGLTVACARCHDHKFDPILTKDYYALAGVFASTMPAERPMFEVDPKVEARYLWVEQRLFDLNYVINLLTKEASTIEKSSAIVAKSEEEVRKLQVEMENLKAQYPQLVQHVEKYWTEKQGAGPGMNRRNVGSTEPFMNAVYDAALYAEVDGIDTHLTWMNSRSGEARDLPVFPHGNVATPGEIVPRHFLTVLSKGDSTFKHGSGRGDLADKIFSDSEPLAARVIVNRVWDWHFGRPLVGTASDFGTQGEHPTHPELLDDLSARFIAHAWSLKWLNREIMLSAAYRQSSHPRQDGLQKDEINSLLWRMNPRRLDVEAYRDSILHASGTLSDQLYGPSLELEAPENNRRTMYAWVSRGRLTNLLKLYDFPDPAQTSPGREMTTTSLQQLFVMNSSFMRNQADVLAKSVEKEPSDTSKVRSLYRKILSRDPNAEEVDKALSYLRQGTLEEYAHVLLATNEEIFWP